jgi:hypothetical protein
MQAVITSEKSVNTYQTTRWISQKTVIVIFVAVRIWNLIYVGLLLSGPHSYFATDLLRMKLKKAIQDPKIKIVNFCYV